MDLSKQDEQQSDQERQIFTNALENIFQTVYIDEVPDGRNSALSYRYISANIPETDQVKSYLP